MIVTVHVATGAAVGALVGRRAAAVALGPLVHMIGDRIPHHDIPSRRFEVASGAAAVIALAARRGPFDAVTLGAIATCVPDVEHLVRLPQPGGRKLFPSHRWHGWHRAGGLPAWVQLAGAGVVIGLILARART